VVTFGPEGGSLGGGRVASGLLRDNRGDPDLGVSSEWFQDVIRSRDEVVVVVMNQSAFGADCLIPPRPHDSFTPQGPQNMMGLFLIFYSILLV
jgi:hypothetical protein